LRPLLEPCRVRAVHVDHGLHPDAHAWAERCVERARSLGLACFVERVDVRTMRGESLEAGRARCALRGARARARDRRDPAHRTSRRTTSSRRCSWRSCAARASPDSRGCRNAHASRSAGTCGPARLAAYRARALRARARHRAQRGSEQPRRALRTQLPARRHRAATDAALAAAAVTAARSAALCGEASALAERARDDRPGRLRAGGSPRRARTRPPAGGACPQRVARVDRPCRLRPAVAREARSGDGRGRVHAARRAALPRVV
jgi:hypothetical protein